MKPLVIKRIAPAPAVLPAPAPAPAVLPAPAPAPAVEYVEVEQLGVDENGQETFSVERVPVPRPPAPASVAAVTTGMTLPKLSRKFLFAGRALFTVSNPKGEHYTYRVRGRETEWPLGSGKKRTSYFLSVKRDGGKWPYRYIGLVNDNGTIKLTGKSEFGVGTREYDVARWAMTAVCASRTIPAGYSIQHAGKCGKCGRTLTDPVSIERGIGPECWKGMS